ncbi:MAG: glycoside hydrolase family 16 protein [Firmicutes bacterium]|nr:glycoside hydrolase family 16 protein [Bacillota bacterium]
MNKIVELVFFCLFLTTTALAQTPANDPHWQLKWYDEFGAFNPDKWFVAHNEIHKPDTKEPQLYRAEQVWVENGNLVIEVSNDTAKCPTPPPTTYICDPCIAGKNYNYKSGCITTKKDNTIQYGYIEARIKFPWRKGKEWGFWPAFWTTFMWGYGTATTAAEIDIVEIFARGNPPDNFEMGTVRYYGPPPPRIGTGPFFYENSNFSYTDWHTYAVEWNENRIIWYLDGKAVASTTNHGIVNPVRLILNLAILDEKKYFPPTTGSWAEEMRVDYVRVHKLICDKTPVNEIPNFNTYNYAVKKSISLSNATTIPANSNIFLRATDFIELKSGFEVQTGRELYLDVTPCEVANTVIYSRE